MPFTKNVEIRKDPERGRHVCALDSLLRGTSVCDGETSELCVPADTPESDIAALIQTSCLDTVLCDPVTEALLARNQSHVKAIRQLYANCFLHHEDSTHKDYLALYTDISMLNHSCTPNAALETRLAKKDDGSCVAVSRVVLLRDISAGEEVTIAYRLIAAPRDIRRSYFKRYYGFECCCPRCCNCPTPQLSSIDSLWSAAPCCSSDAETTLHRRLSKLFDYVLDPLVSETIVPTLSRLDALVGLLRLYVSQGDADIWGVFGKNHSAQYFWKGAAVREAILDVIKRDPESEVNKLIHDARVDLQQLVAAQERFTRFSWMHASADS